MIQINKLKKNINKLIVSLIETDTSLKKQAFKSTFWVFFEKIFNLLLLFIKTIFLARYLSPEDFGLFGIASLIIVGLESFSQTGVQQALISKKNNLPHYLDSAWTLQVMRGVVIGFILIIFGPIVANFYNKTQLNLIIKILGIIEITKSFNNIGIVYFDKELKFHKKIFFQIVGNIFDFIFSIIFAIFFKNVWSLVIGLFVKSLVQLYHSYKVHKYRPKLNFDFNQIRDLNNFGKWIFGISILIFVGGQGDDFYVSKSLGLVALGFYQMANNWSHLPSIQFSNVINNVSFPIYAKLNNNWEKLNKVYFKILKITSIISLPFAAILTLFSKELTILLLGNKWLPIVPSFRILALAALIKSVVSTSTPLFYGLNKPNFEFKIQLIRAITTVILIIPFSNWYGIKGASLTVLCGSISMIIFYVNATSNLLNIKQNSLFKVIQSPIIATIIMTVTILSIKHFFDPLEFTQSLFKFFFLICYILISISLYISSLLIIEKVSIQNK